MSDAGMLEPTWFDNVKEEEFITTKLKLPNHCPSTLILISENMVPGMFVAGGSCITAYDSLHQFSDIDIFCNSPDALLHTNQLLDMLGFKAIGKNNGALMEYEDALGIKAQIIFATRLKSLPTLLSTFDFSICKVGFDHENFMEGSLTRQDIQNKVLRCNPVSKNPAKLLFRICKYSGKGYGVTAHLIQEIWLRNQQNPVPVIKVDPDNTEMSRLIQELVKQQQIQQQQIMQPLMPIAPNWPPLLPADQELDPPYMSPAPVTIQPTTFKWTRTTTGTGPGDYQQPCSRCGSISHTTGSCY